MIKEWKKVKLGNVLNYTQPTKFITKNINDDGSVPVLTANKAFVLGYTNEAEDVYTEVPAIIFDDFTTAIKYVNFPFKVRSSALKILNNNSKITSIKYLFEYMSTISFQSKEHKRYWISTYQNLKIPLPPLPEQQKIAEILSTVDEKIAVIDHQITATEELKKGLMQRLLTKGIGHTEFKDSPLGKIPKSWEVITIKKLLESNRILSHLDGNHGGLYPKASEFTDEGIPYIGANSFENGKVRFDLCKKLPKERADKFRKGVAKNGDVLFAHNATVGPVAYLQTNLDYVILSTTATYYRLDEQSINSKYWFYYLQTPKFVNQYSKVMGQSTRNQVPITTQRNFYAVLPDYEEQIEISRILNQISSKIYTLYSKLESYKQLKKGLMQQLLTGKIRVTNLIEA